MVLEGQHISFKNIRCSITDLWERNYRGNFQLMRQVLSALVKKISERPAHDQARRLASQWLRIGPVSGAVALNQGWFGAPEDIWQHLETFIFKNIYQFIYFTAPGLSCSMWDLVPWPGTEPGSPVGEHSLSYLVCLCSVTSDSVWPYGMWPTRLLCPWGSPGKNTGVGCHFLPRGIFLTQGSNPGLLHCRQILYHLSLQGSYWITKEIQQRHSSLS